MQSREPFSKTEAALHHEDITISQSEEELRPRRNALSEETGDGGNSKGLCGLVLPMTSVSDAPRAAGDLMSSSSSKLAAGDGGSEALAVQGAVPTPGGSTNDSSKEDGVNPIAGQSVPAEM